jgi:hypothetical protein
VHRVLGIFFLVAGDASFPKDDQEVQFVPEYILTCGTLLARRSKRWKRRSGQFILKSPYMSVSWRRATYMEEVVAWWVKKPVLECILDWNRFPKHVCSHCIWHA